VLRARQRQVLLATVPVLQLAGLARVPQRVAGAFVGREALRDQPAGGTLTDLEGIVAVGNAKTTSVELCLGNAPGAGTHEEKDLRAGR
jgi:hypothetical protein